MGEESYYHTHSLCCSRWVLPPAKVQRFSHLVIKSLATHTHVHMTLGLGMDLLGLYCPGLHTWNIPLVAICQPEAKASFCSCQLLTVGDGSAGSTRPLLQDRHASAGAGHLDMAGPVACTPPSFHPCSPCKLNCTRSLSLLPVRRPNKSCGCTGQKNRAHASLRTAPAGGLRLHTRRRSAARSAPNGRPRAPRPASGARVRHMPLRGAP